MRGSSVWDKGAVPQLGGQFAAGKSWRKAEETATCTRSSVDRAVGFYPICRRFESCRVLMAVTKKTTEELVAQRQQANQQERTPLSVVVDNVRSLDNVGLLFRLCELARIDTLYLTGYTGYPAMKDDSRPKEVAARHQRRIEKTAVYALPLQPWEHTSDPVPLVTQMKKDGRTIIALEQTDTSMPYQILSAQEYALPATLIVGHERQGVRQELLELADHIIEIPILGQGNSHNVATATGIVLYHILHANQLI